jgi:hypothetical protein
MRKLLVVSLLVIAVVSIDAWSMPNIDFENPIQDGELNLGKALNDVKNGKADVEDAKTDWEDANNVVHGHDDTAVDVKKKDDKKVDKAHTSSATATTKKDDKKDDKKDHKDDLSRKRKPPKP